MYTYLQSGARHARWPLPVDGIERSVTSPREWFPYPISLFNEHHARVRLKKKGKKIHVQRCLRRVSKDSAVKRIDRVTCKKISHELQSSIDTVFQLHTPFNRFLPNCLLLIANIFLRPLLACNHATMKEQGFLSFVLSFARNYHPFLSREEN